MLTALELYIVNIAWSLSPSEISLQFYDSLIFPAGVLYTVQ